MNERRLSRPSADHRERRACADKAPFDSKKSAGKQAARRGRTQKPYLCPYCSQWHLATKRKRA